MRMSISKRLMNLARSVEFETTRISGVGTERDSGGGFILAFCQADSSCTSRTAVRSGRFGCRDRRKRRLRIAEVHVCSSCSTLPFTLMIGKLLGVSLVALHSALGHLRLAFGAFALYGVIVLSVRKGHSNSPYPRCAAHVFLSTLASSFFLPWLFCLRQLCTR